MDGNASAAEIGVGPAQNLVNHEGSHLSTSVVGHGSESRSLSSLVEAFRTGGSLDTFLPRFDTQAAGGGGAGIGGPSLGAGGLGAGLPSQGSGAPGLRIIPIISISERYDSNVFFAPPLPGLDPQDWVTTVSPRLFLQDNGRIMGTTIYVGAIGEYYAKNTDLSYIGYNAGASLNVSGLLRRYVPQASLYFTGNYSYTPLPPAFIGGGGQTNPGVGEEVTSQVPTADTYIRGIQAQRVNTTSYSGGMAGSVILHPTFFVQGAYTYSVVTFGTPYVTQEVPGYTPLLTNTTTQTVSVGPVYRLTPFDSINLNYQYETSKFGNNQGGYESHTATVGYQKTLAASYVGRIYGGASLYTQEAGAQAGTTTTTSGQQVAFNGGGSLTWARRYTQAMVAYTVGIYPNYVGVPGPVLSNNLSFQGTHRLGDNVGVFVRLNYADNKAVGADNSTNAAQIAFTSYDANASIWYRITPTLFSSLSYEWGLYKGNFTGQGDDKILRNAVTLSLTKAWY